MVSHWTTWQTRKGVTGKLTENMVMKSVEEGLSASKLFLQSTKLDMKIGNNICEFKA